MLLSLTPIVSLQVCVSQPVTPGSRGRVKSTAGDSAHELLTLERASSPHARGSVKPLPAKQSHPELSDFITHTVRPFDGRRGRIALYGLSRSTVMRRPWSFL